MGSGNFIAEMQILIRKNSQLQAELESIRNQWHIDLNDKVQLQTENKRLKEKLDERELERSQNLYRRVSEENQALKDGAKGGPK